MTRLLILQDEEMNQDNVTRRLIRRGFEVHAVPELGKALEEARKKQFDAALVDLNLADMDGWEAARRLREDPAMQAAPLIGMCNDELAGAEAMALDAGCVAFEPRPVELDRLIGLINSAVSAKA